MPHKKKSGRAANGSGSIRKRTVTRNGKSYTYWEGRVTVGMDPITGKQVQRTITGKTQQEVAQRAREIAVEVDQKTYKAPCKLTVGEWLDIWQEEYLGSVKPRTADSYRTTVEVHLKPALGAVKLEALTTPMVQKFYNSLQQPAEGRGKPLSGKTVRNVNGVFHRALEQAVEIGYLRQNPATACKLPRAEHPEIRPLDSDTITRFLSVIQGHKFAPIYTVTLFTGMRQGEILGLTWEAVDFDKGVIHITKQLQKTRRGDGSYQLVSPKNGKGRYITPAASVMNVLRAQRRRQALWKLAAGPAWEESNLVFTNELGHNLSAQTVYLHFKKLVAQIGCPDVRFHDLRHSYAVSALQSGDDVKTVQENLGHHTAAFTLDVYGHVTAQMRQASAERMEQFIRSVSGQ